jgi:hypothetical protein
LWMWTFFPFNLNGDPFTSWINKTPKLYTTLFVDACFEWIYGAIYLHVPGVEVEANHIWIWIFQTNQ